MNSTPIKELILSDINCIDWTNDSNSTSTTTATNQTGTALDQAIKATFQLISIFEASIGPLMFVNSIIYRNQKNMVMLIKFHLDLNNQLFLEKFSKFEFNSQMTKLQPAALRILTPKIEYPDLKINIMNQEFVTLYSNIRMHPMRLELLELEEKKQNNEITRHQHHHHHHHFQHNNLYRIQQQQQQQPINMANLLNSQDVSYNQFILLNSNKYLNNNNNNNNNNENELSSLSSSSSSSSSNSSDEFEEISLEKEVSMINNGTLLLQQQQEQQLNLMKNQNVVFFPSLNYYYYSTFF
jgi:hypothetical protein